MPTDTIDADSVCFATTSALTNEPIANMNVGYYIGTTYASAIRFVLPSVGAINSATLKVYNAANSGGGALVTSLSVRTSAQSLPTAPIGSQWTPFGSEVSITSPTAEIDVTTLLQAALSAEVIDGAVCFIWLDDGSDDGLLQFDGIDPSLDPYNFPPQLVLDYDDPGPGGETIECETGGFILDGQDALIAIAPRIPANRGVFVLAGQSVSFDLAARITAESGSFVLGGSSCAERYARAIVARTGQFELSGQTGKLVGPEIAIEAESGEFELSGGDASITAGNIFSADTGTFALVGGTAAQSLGMPVDAGAFALDGGDYADKIEPFFDAGSGSFVMTGGNATINKVPQAAAIHIYQHFLARS